MRGDSAPKQDKDAVAVFGGGCFWCTEAVFSRLKGVKSVMPGYSGGSLSNPSYEQVSEGNTGHVESSRIGFDPSVISYKDLLTVFFGTHDPTQQNRQGNDIGAQYQSTVFYADDGQKREAEAFIRELDAAKAYDEPVATELKPLAAFYPAEDYHRHYYEHHKDEPYCELVIEPKLEKLRKRFAELLKQ